MEFANFDASLTHNSFDAPSGTAPSFEQPGHVGQTDGAQYADAFLPPNQPISSIPSGTVYICNVCNKHCRSGNELKKHYRNHDPPLPCPHDVCDKMFPWKKALDRHVRSNHAQWAVNHPELANLSPLRDVKCEYCGFTADRPDNVQRHIKKRKTKCGERRIGVLD